MRSIWSQRSAHGREDKRKDAKAERRRESQEWPGDIPLNAFQAGDLVEEALSADELEGAAVFWGGESIS